MITTVIIKAVSTCIIAVFAEGSLIADYDDKKIKNL